MSLKKFVDALPIPPILKQKESVMGSHSMK